MCAQDAVEEECMQALISHTIRSKQTHVTGLTGGRPAGAPGEIPVMKFVVVGFPQTHAQVHAWVASGMCAYVFACCV